MLKAPLHARDLRTNVKEYGFEKGVVATLEQLLDEFVEYRHHQRDLVELVNGCINQIEKLATVGEGMRDKIKALERDKGDELGEQS